LPAIYSAIEGFREAAILPERWPQALDAFSRAFDSVGTSLVLKSTSVGSIAVSTSIRPFIPDYMAGTIRDPRETRVKPGMHENFMPDQAYFSKHEIANEPYYQEFLAPRGFGWNAVAALHGGLLISVKRGLERPSYDGTILRALNSALPWLRSASRAASLTWRANFAGQLSAFERVGRGAVLIDAGGRVLDTNACVSCGDGFDISGGVLQAPRAADRLRLQRFLNAVIGAGTAQVPQPTTVTLRRPSGLRPWVLDGIACPDAIRSLHSEAAALILITDVEGSNVPRQSTLREVFGLTATEADLACILAAGHSLREAAVKLHISEGHARQRLQAVFNKTGTSRQGELVAVLGKLT
jgi:DNA-binding CsgD family transcriptional regulator